ncbi:uncharacterized protein LOC129915153 [Episyrphus balteatus]|uniref:uncharacterized protein LOC129915153 n=1 Tax=Episyrphus balteatus TaxID=286459 RepID=UPI0024859AD6|nr:uncharacterized protein LOC129915153 [Episyrphus balteatus]
MRDLQGYISPIIFGGPEPGVIISKTDNNQVAIGGHVGHILKTFAKRINAQLNTSNIRPSISFTNLHKLVLNGSTEIAGCVGMIIDSTDWFTYPYNVFDFGVMLPMEPYIQTYKVFVIHWEALVLTTVIFILLSACLEANSHISRPNQQRFFILNFFLNINCFRGILGQSFSQRPKASCSTKIVYSLIFLLGIITVTSYDAFLQSFMAEPPREKIIRSFDDLQSSGLKIFTYQGFVDNFLYKFTPTLMQKYSNSFKGEINYEVFERARDSLNTNYGKKLDVFRNHMQDLQKSILPIMFAKSEPGMIISKNDKNDTIIAGYVGHIFKAFAKRLNAKLHNRF